EVRKTVYDNIQLPAVFMAYRMPAEGTKDYYALSMLQTLLSGGKSSRLYKALVDEQQKALQVAAFPYALEDGGIFILLGLANMGVKLPDLEKAIEIQIDSVKRNGLTEKEFQKLQNQTETDFVSQNSTQEGIAQSLNNYYTFFGNPDLINTEINRYLAVTREDIVRVAKKYLTRDNRVVLYYLPKSAENKEEK
ncbi:MAG TPA: insulinase family protein, partial [Bacteroidales bacterium]|nr:insulinase family protein [Bacteroidales bacterium]